MTATLTQCETPAFSNLSPRHEKLNNYAFIEQAYPELYKLCCQVDEYFSKDASCCLLKIRLFLELWCHEYAKHYDVSLSVNDDLCVLITQLKNQCDLDDFSLDHLNKLRLESNKALHIRRDYLQRFRVDVELSAQKMKSLVAMVHQLTLVLMDTTVDEVGIWQAPVNCDDTDLMVKALNGNADASLSIAKCLMARLKKAEQAKNIDSKCYKQDKQDLNYWLNKAEHQGSLDCWFVYAQASAAKYLPAENTQQVERYFKQALKHDDTGDVYWHFYQYLSLSGRNSWALLQLNAAGNKGHEQALNKLQSINANKNKDQYEQWFKRGIELNNKQALVVDVFNKMRCSVADEANDLLKKRFRSAYIKAQAYQVKGFGFIKGFCLYHSLMNLDAEPSQGIDLMIAEKSSLPDYLNAESVLFSVFSKEDEFQEQALDLLPYVLYQTESPQAQAQLKYDAAVILMNVLKTKGSIKTPFPLKVLLRESASEGCKQALDFICTPLGKAVMTNQRYSYQKTTHHKVDRSKQKKAKKQARACRRK